MLSIIEKVLFLKELPFFHSMTIDHLNVVAHACEEELFAADMSIFQQGDPGGALYVIVHGRVGIEQEKRAGSISRLATLGMYAYFGEMELFDSRPRTIAAIAVQDTLILRLRREPMLVLIRQYPELGLDILRVLSHRLYEATERIVELTRAKPAALQKLYDQLE